MDSVVLISEEARKRAYDTARRGGGGVDSKSEPYDASGEMKAGRKPREHKPARKWRFGELEFEAAMRMLDTAGYRTGYMYRQPLVKQDTCRSKSDVEIPPASSSYSYVFDEENLFKHSPLKKILETRKANDRTKFLTTPNLYIPCSLFLREHPIKNLNSNRNR